MGSPDQFCGERSSLVRDPFGHEWLLGSHIEEVSHEDMQRRFTAMFDSQDAPARYEIASDVDA